MTIWRRLQNTVQIWNPADDLPQRIKVPKPKEFVEINSKPSNSIKIDQPQDSIKLNAIHTVPDETFSPQQPLVKANKDGSS